METRSEVHDVSQSKDIIHDLSNDTPQTTHQVAVEESSDTEKIENASKDTLLNSIAEVFNFDTTKLTDVDKFKRRLIRSIARSMLVEKIPEEEMWAKLRKDTDCDCHMLWKRMRALTLKKLRRLLAAEDRWENITKVARLSLTDWLLFDLVLVHEKVDLIGQDTMTEQSREPNVLYELFDLVQKYDIERLKGEPLIKAWVFLTLEYNKRGRKCSPMLLQRRWYQMKHIARIKFYSFWFAYGGARSKLEKAWQQKPSQLQAEIAKKYRSIIIEPFPEWEELVMKKRVVLREDFESIREPVNNKNVSDVQIIEIPVETIQIDEDSDAEDIGTSQEQNEIMSQSTNKDMSQPNNEILGIRIDKIKSEAIEQTSNPYEITDVQVLESMHIPIKENDLQTEPNLVHSNDIPSEFDNQVLPKIACVTGGVEVLDSDDDCNDALITSPQQYPSNESKVIDTNQNTSGNISEEVCTNTELPTSTELSTANNCNNDDCKNDLNYVDDKPDFEVQLDDLIIIDDGIALEDDGIDLHDEDDHEDLITNITSESKRVESQNDHEENKEELDETPKFDYKLLLTPVVYTKKLDDMDVFKFIDFNNVRDIRIIECSYIESKPIEEKKENTNTGEDICEQLPSGKKECIKPEECMENPYEKKAYSPECISDSQRIKYSSWLLQKPKNRNYNPIQLCKNPDFNTRLKRLTAGFLSCEKNRLLLKECKRLTIDLHKTFECKLIDGKLYLKNSKFTDNSEKADSLTRAVNLGFVTEAETDSTKVSISNIVPIISPTINNQKLTTDEIPVKLDGNETNNSTDRYKTIKKLLTVEITPMKADNINYKPPVEIVAELNAKHMELSQDAIIQDEKSNKLDNCDTSTVLEKDNVIGQSKVKENTECIDLEQVNSTVQRKLSRHRFQNMVGKTLINGPKNYRFGYSLNAPTQVPVTWNTGPRSLKNTKEKDIFGDVLLASDTLEKMLKLLSNQTIDDKRKKKKRKVIEMELSEKNYDNNKTQEIREETKGLEDESEKNKDKASLAHENNVIKKTNAPKRGRRKKLDSTSVQVKTSRYCCWALEKLLTNKIPKEPHYCPKPICICCCRDRLLEKSLQEKQEKGIETLFQELIDYKTRKGKKLVKEKATQNLVPPHKKLKQSSSTQKNNPISDVSIVLSDDDDDVCKAGQNFKTNINVCETQTENANVNPRPNSEENTNITPTTPLSCNVEESIDITSQVSENPESGLDTSTLENTTLTSKSNIKGSNFTCKTRVYSKPSSTVVNNSSSTNKQVPQKENITQQYINPSFQNNVKEIQCSISELYGNLASAPKIIKESIMLSESDVYLKENLFKNSFSTSNTNPPKVPIFLGKNKILLCSNPTFESPTKVSSKITEGAQAVLPPGVQIVLLPSGELALSIEPGINFTPEEINKLSGILTAVHQQLNISEEGIAKKSEMLNINIETDKNTEIDNKNLSENENVLITPSNEKDTDSLDSIEKNADCIQTIQIDTAASSEIPGNKNECLLDVGPKNIGSDTGSAIVDLDNIKEVSFNTQEIVNDVHRDAQNLENSTESGTQNNKKSILSDLMEMSGISENDAICDDKIQVNPSKGCTVTSGNPLPGTGTISKTEPNKVIYNNQISSSQFDILNQPTICKALEKRKELTIVSSFAELKNCHEKSYQFYKMDIETGQISPINLKIKRGMIGEKKKRKISARVDPKCIIDLTDEQVNATEENTLKTSEISQNMASELMIKPIKLIRSIRRGLNKSPSLQPLNPNSLTPTVGNRMINILRRKKSLLSELLSDGSKISDNMANDKFNRNEETNDDAQKSSDSDSDDEPLAKKALRKRDIDVSASELFSISPVVEENEVELTEYLMPEFLEPNNLELNDEDAEENCILGV